VLTHTRASFTINSEQFTAESSRLSEPGFTAVMDWLKPGDESELTVRAGEKLEVKNVEVSQRETTCPDYLSESGRWCCAFHLGALCYDFDPCSALIQI
jgi:DNA topoisomerase IA